MMPVKRAATFVFVCATLAAAAAADTGSILVDVYGKLLLILVDGTQNVLGDSAISAALSKDGKMLAFTRNEDPRAIPNTSQILSIAPISGGAAKQIAKLPRGAHFGSLDWLPDGRGILYEGQAGHLYIVYLSGNNPEPRDLGPWYQGFSVSSDASEIVHAVNSPTMGIEVLNLASGKRTLIHKTSKVVWDAKFSPDGEWIAYQMTLHDPPRATDAEPNCAPPTIGLHVYSTRTKADRAVTIAGAPKDWDNVKSFRWSPDSKRLALTLGTTDCDYPGSANGVFVTSVDLKSQIRVSQNDMSFEPIFSPDGASLAFVDFSDFPARLVRYDFATASRTLIRQATPNDNYYRLLDWK